MADTEDASRKRDSHYNQQRSSLRSGRSRTPSCPQLRPQSRPASARLAQCTLDDDYTSPPQSPSVTAIPDSPSPAPYVPRIPKRKQSLDKGRTRSKSGTSSRHESAGSSARTGSRGKTIEELLFFDAPQSGLDEVEAPAPVQNPNEASRYEHYTLEEVRSEQRDSPQSGTTRSPRFSFLPGRITPGTNASLTALPTIERHRPEKTPSCSAFVTELYSISYLILFSILGTLARLGVQWLTYYPDAPSTFPVLWANFGGTLLMGFLAQDRRLFRDEWGHRTPTPPWTPPTDEEKALDQQNRASSHAKVKKTIPLYIGLATGFCGSLTSFSSFMRDVFLAFLNDLRAPNTSGTTPRNDGYSVMAGLAVIIITIAVCYSALKVGAHIALLLDRFTPTLPFRHTRAFVDPLIVILAWGTWLGAVFMAIWPPDRPSGPNSRGSWANETWRGQAIFACVFAPAGCLLRFYISLKLNPIIPSFPLGTFAVNIFGTAVLGMAYDLQHVSISGSGVGGGRVGCQVLQGVMDGFDGCLSTVSTWALEIDALKRGHAWKYAFASIAAGIAVLLVVMGSVRWSVGWTAMACVTSRQW
ncbi:hypothetical protein BU23DRAFT_556284 [Bimuria novae-zelandiae CBS 107.79]|uniref:Chromosome condensation protein-like protein n=1 Tax=Bimuria novae-zelandiae CBS 107.79 TaxID=1447943 RepID=A0A6A5V7J3_9PLEO|nr:hypothetical protein BU23DRAFT_556284 [Bimuria novae-zelandiae CBS 107.79]